MQFKYIIKNYFIIFIIIRYLFEFGLWFFFSFFERILQRIEKSAE